MTPSKIDKELLPYSGKITNWEIIHFFDIDSPLLENCSDLNKSSRLFSGHLLSPKVPNIKNAEIKIVEDSDEWLSE